MTITETRAGGILVLAAAGRVDSTSSPTLERALLGAIDAGERRLVLDLGGVDYISSAGLRVLLVAARRVNQARGAFTLCGLAEPVRQVFELAGFLQLFSVEATPAAAAARVAAAS